jgi:mRNA-degrading endonuclease RelE of RelBE toxin-antitoxin system
MRYAIVFAPEAVQDFRALDAHVRAEVRDALETHLRHEPMKTSKSRIKRLRGLARPQYRLRVGDVRVFYDVAESLVAILAMVVKSEAQEWLERFGAKS